MEGTAARAPRLFSATHSVCVRSKLRLYSPFIYMELLPTVSALITSARDLDFPGVMTSLRALILCLCAIGCAAREEPRPALSRGSSRWVAYKGTASHYAQHPFVTYTTDGNGEEGIVWDMGRMFQAVPEMIALGRLEQLFSQLKKYGVVAMLSFVTLVFVLTSGSVVLLSRVAPRLLSCTCSSAV